MNLFRLFFPSSLILLGELSASAQLPEITHQFIPTNNCQRCHEVPGERDAAAGLTDRVRMSEWKIWQAQDKHASAYQVLLEPRGQRIGKLIGKDVTAAEAGCIQCHTSNAEDALWSPACFQNGENLYIAEGVSCQTCHGPAELWEAEHIKPDWREKTPEEKLQFGFNSLEDPALRAATCLSCHVGNSDRGRLITHEMYAAGHPPLSGFEMEAFADKMPRHWRYSHEKSGGQPFNFERTRAVLLGSVVAFRRAVDLASEAGDNWPELAHLECFSCHHELQAPSWRQEENERGAVGRPRLELGCLPLVRIAALLAGGTAGREQFDQLLAQSQQPFAQNIFGDITELIALRNAADQWSDRIEQQLVEMPLDEERVREFLDLLLGIAAEGTHDYDTARQLTGAISVVAEELARSGAQVPGLDNLQKQLANLSARGFALVSTDDKRVEDKFHQQLSNRARFKPRVFSSLMASLRESTAE